MSSRPLRRPVRRSRAACSARLAGGSPTHRVRARRRPARRVRRRGDPARPDIEARDDVRRAVRERPGWRVGRREAVARGVRHRADGDLRARDRQRRSASTSSGTLERRRDQRNDASAELGDLLQASIGLGSRLAKAADEQPEPTYPRSCSAGPATLPASSCACSMRILQPRARAVVSSDSQPGSRSQRRSRTSRRCYPRAEVFVSIDAAIERLALGAAAALVSRPRRTARRRSSSRSCSARPPPRASR